MRAAVAGAGMMSAVLLGCEAPPPEPEEKGAELRRASFRSYAAAERLERCGGAGRPEAAGELRRFETLKDFARRRGAGAAHSLWRGENGWNALARRGGAVRPCAAGEAAYVEALRGFSASLDELVNGIMSYED